MKIPKCNRSVSKKHNWWQYGSTNPKAEIAFPQCLYCGMVDDRKLPLPKGEE